jgi:hypothetical protein
MAAPDRLAKAAVHYRPGERKRRCANCTMFYPPGGCAHVAGAVRPGDLCDDFKSAFRRSYKKET